MIYYAIILEKDGAFLVHTQEDVARNNVTYRQFEIIGANGIKLKRKIEIVSIPAIHHSPCKCRALLNSFTSEHDRTLSHNALYTPSKHIADLCENGGVTHKGYCSCTHVVEYTRRVKNSGIYMSRCVLYGFITNLLEGLDANHNSYNPTTDFRNFKIPVSLLPLYCVKTNVEPDSPLVALPFINKPCQSNDYLRDGLLRDPITQECPNAKRILGNASAQEWDWLRNMFRQVLRHLDILVLANPHILQDDENVFFAKSKEAWYRDTNNAPIDRPYP